MLTYILIAAISFCAFHIFIQLHKMNNIGEQYYEAKFKQQKEK